MPLASLSAGAAALLGAAASAAAGGIGAGVKALTSSKDRKHEKELETIHTTKPGFDDFGDELVDEGDQFALSKKPPRVIFPNTMKKKPMGMVV